MKCPFCGGEHEPKILFGMPFHECLECPPDTMFYLPVAHETKDFQRFIQDEMDLAMGNPTKTQREARELAESIYLAMDWPTFPNVRGL